MAFICGDVPLNGPEREWLNSFNFMDDGKAVRYEIWSNDKIIYRERWAVDSDRKMFILCIGGGFGTFDLETRPLILRFVWNEIVCNIEARYHGKGDFTAGLKMKWIIEKIKIPREYENNKQAIVEAIKEAAYSYDTLGKRDRVIEMEVEVTCEPVFTR